MNAVFERSLLTMWIGGCQEDLIYAKRCFKEDSQLELDEPAKHRGQVRHCNWSAGAADLPVVA
jgi:hypothetical protein